MSDGEKARIPRAEATVTEYDGSIEPRLRVAQGESFVLESKDNFFDLVEKPEDLASVGEAPEIAARQVIRANPLAGPVFVEGARPGDTLAVTIERIDIREWGWTGTWPGSGIVDLNSDWSEVQGPWATIIHHSPGPSGTLADGTASVDLDRHSEWPLAPFIGTIVTAPERGSENSVVGQGEWGGNLDCRDITAGNTVFLNVTHEGALLFAGDLHASQADGELSGIADEVSGEMTLRCTVLPGRTVPGVCRIETPDALIQLDSARRAGTLTRAIDSCYLNLMLWLVEDHGFSRAEAYVHMTANSGVRANLYQVCDGLYTCGVSFPKRSLPSD